MRIEVVYSPAAGELDCCEVELPAGSTLGRALEASGLVRRHPELGAAPLNTGIWGRRQPLDAPLRERDRVEVYRPLIVDPKEARRQRYKRQRG